MKRPWFLVTQQLLCALLLALVTTAEASDDSASIDLITHNSILIEASGARIWPHIVEPNGWKQGAALVPLASTDGRDRFKAVTADQPDRVLFYVENVELWEGRRRTIKLNSPDGSLLGYASWVLTPLEDTTLVEYHVYSALPLPAVDGISISPEERSKLQREAYEPNRHRFGQELAALKRLVESKP